MTITREEAIELAKEAGAVAPKYLVGLLLMEPEGIERLCNLVAAKVREECAMKLDEEADRQEKAWTEYIASGKQGPATSFHNVTRKYASAIRARSLPRGEEK